EEVAPLLVGPDGRAEDGERERRLLAPAARSAAREGEALARERGDGLPAHPRSERRASGPLVLRERGAGEEERHEEERALHAIILRRERLRRSGALSCRRRR